MEYAAKTRRTWSDEQLVCAVRDAHSWRSVQRKLGLRGHGPSLAVRRASIRLGLDTSHFGPALHCSDDELTAALATATSWGQLLAALGLRTASRRAQQLVANRAAQLDLDTSHLDAALRKRRTPTAESSLFPDLVHLREAAEPLIAAWFLLRGFWPAIPAESRPYDFLLETPAGVKRVQVKTTTFKASSGSWFVSIGRHAGGGDRHDQRLAYSSDEVDLFAIVDGDLTLRLIPRAAVSGRKSICLRLYDEFTTGSAASMALRWTIGADAAAEPFFRPWRGSAGGEAIEKYATEPSARARPPEPSYPKPYVDADEMVTVDSSPPAGAMSTCAPNRWSEAELRAAVGEATSWADMLRTFGFKPSSTKPRRLLQREVQRFGIDTGHFAGKRTWSDRQLVAAAPTARTWAELCEALGVSAQGGHYDSIIAAAERLGVSLQALQLGPKVGRDAIGFDLPSGPLPDRLSAAAPSIAAAWFLLCGLAVSVPSEPEAYDLVVDMADGLKRVQVKSTAFRDRRGSWVARVGHRPHGSPDAADFVAYDADDIDLFFVVDGDMLLYLIPLSAIGDRATLSLRSYREFIVGDASSLLDSRNPTTAPSAPTEVAS